LPAAPASEGDPQDQQAVAATATGFCRHTSGGRLNKTATLAAQAALLAYRRVVKLFGTRPLRMLTVVARVPGGRCKRKRPLCNASRQLRLMRPSDNDKKTHRQRVPVQGN